MYIYIYIYTHIYILCNNHKYIYIYVIDSEDLQLRRLPAAVGADERHLVANHKSLIQLVLNYIV